MKTFLLVFAFFALPFLIEAHSVGVSHEAQVGEYFVDIGYNVPIPRIGESVTFDFNLPEEHGNVRYTDVWVRIESEKGVVFAGGLYNAEFGGPRLVYAFPEAGAYTIHVRYENGTETIVETSFPLTVEGGTSVLGNTAFIGAGLLLVGILIGVVSKRFLRA